MSLKITCGRVVPVLTPCSEGVHTPVLTLNLGVLHSFWHFSSTLSYYRAPGLHVERSGEWSPEGPGCLLIKYIFNSSFNPYAPFLCHPGIKILVEAPDCRRSLPPAAQRTGGAATGARWHRCGHSQHDGSGVCIAVATGLRLHRRGDARLLCVEASCNEQLFSLVF